MKGYISLSAVPMRAEASDRSEMVNQLLAGDTMEIVDRQERWSLVQAEYDGYRGWIETSSTRHSRMPPR